MVLGHFRAAAIAAGQASVFSDVPVMSQGFVQDGPPSRFA